MKKMISFLLVIALLMLPAAIADTELINGVEMTIETQYFSAEQAAEGAIVVSTLVSTALSNPEAVADIHYANGEININVTQNGSTYYINVYTYDDGSMQIDTLTPAAQSTSPSWPASGFFGSSGLAGLFGFGGAAEFVTGRPSAEWLAMTDREIVTDMCYLICNNSFIESMDLPDELLSILDPAAEYSPDPAVVLYAPEDMTALISALYDAETIPDSLAADHGLFGSLFSYLIGHLCGDGELALYGSIGLYHCIPVYAEYMPVISIYTPADGSAASCIMVYHSSSDGITSIEAHVMPYCIVADLMDPASSISLGLTQCGIDIKRAGDEYAEFPAAFEAPAGTVIANADDDWLSAAALDISADVIARSGDLDIMSMYTSDPSVLDICSKVGSLPIQFGQVVSIERFDESVYTASLGDTPADSFFDLLMKYYGPQGGLLMAQSQRNMYGPRYAAASVICSADDVYYANADFVSCNVTVSFGGDINIVVSFANYGNGIITATGTILPVE